MNIGIDIGSTTAKVVVIDSTNTIIFTEYKRHKALIVECLISIIQNLAQQFSEQANIRICFTGSAGMGIAEQNNLPFIQEVIAASSVIQTYFPKTASLIDIGGEDAKIIFYEQGKAPDIRMNGSCAGGTGAFIDQIASLLNIETTELQKLASNSKHTYSIASRCGVFAKTDVQNLISRKVATADIAASTFNAVSSQVINALSRGKEIKPPIVCIGGPLTYIPYLTKNLQEQLGVKPEEILVPENSHIFPAWGAALSAKNNESTFDLQDIIRIIQSKSNQTYNNRLPALFASENDFQEWKKNQSIIPIPETTIDSTTDSLDVFLGIDSGSTTTKVVMLNAKGELIASHYDTNKGNAIKAVITGIKACNTKLNNIPIQFIHTAVTGYGEDLIRTAFSIDYGIVETIAHTTAAQKIAPDVSFIMDIGGQDMKAIYLKNGAIQSIEINEACSSGCGSFIQNFAQSLSHTVSDFGNLACNANHPCDLGSRCTVFMNSQVKQALREGAEVSEIASGLAYSVIKNALHKVLQIKNMDVLGNKILVQGGTFKNPSVFRAMELLTQKQIFCSNYPELMGALGAAYYAQSMYKQNNKKSSFIEFSKKEEVLQYQSKQLICKGCSNNCTIQRNTFSNNSVHYSGNKCEKVFSSKGVETIRGENIFEYKYNLLFDRETDPIGESCNVTIGIPRILGMYANYPFWHSLFTLCGIGIELSDESTTELFESGQGTIMADNICFPAKLAHGHFVNIAKKNIDRIFYPLSIYEENEHPEAKNSYNCPIVSSYGEVLESAIPLAKRNNIPFDYPVISFRNELLLKKGCWRYLHGLGVSKNTFKAAFKSALEEQKNFKEQYRLEGFRILERAKKNNTPIVMLAGRPYHIDPLIHQKTSHILCELGASVISEEIIDTNSPSQLTDYLHVAQWNYPNRILKSAQWVLNNTEYSIHFAHLNSFGCGPDSFFADELKEWFDASQASYMFIRVDEINSTGSIRLRLRSFIETIKLTNNRTKKATTIQRTPSYTKKDRHRHIVGPFFTKFHSPFIAPVFAQMGYSMESLPPSDKKSVELGLQFANNEVCYPATLIVGDIIKYLQNTTKPLNEIAVVITQTGGQCRASNYISLIKKAVVHAGITNVPVISLASSDSMFNEQPGFDIPWKKIINLVATGMIFGDILSRMHYATIVREKEAGSTEKLTENYLQTATALAYKNDCKGILQLLEHAVTDYNNATKQNCIVPQIGIVGEIFLKFNPYANMQVADWLIAQNIEPRFPDLLDFFAQEFVNLKVNSNNNLSNAKWTTQLYASLLENKLENISKKAEKIASKFAYYRPKKTIYEESKYASEVLNLVNQFGEGWLIPAEIIGFAHEGVNNVVSLQPFGCIANHIVAKGLEKKIKTLYPHTNLLFLDFDGGSSEVNIFNRLHFLVQNAKNEHLN